MRSFPSYMRRVAMLASIAILWVAIASGAAPLLHHGGGAHAERCDDARHASVTSDGAVCFHNGDSIQPAAPLDYSENPHRPVVESAFHG